LVKIGDFDCRDESKLQRAYYLCYEKDHEYVRFSKKFGFTVMGVNQKVTKINFDWKKTLKELKMLSGSTKSVDYLAKKLA